MVLVLIESLASGRFCLQTHDAYIDIQDKEDKTYVIEEEIDI